MADSNPSSTRHTRASQSEPLVEGLLTDRRPRRPRVNPSEALLQEINNSRNHLRNISQEIQGVRRDLEVIDQEEVFPLEEDSSDISSLDPHSQVREEEAEGEPNSEAPPPYVPHIDTPYPVEGDIFTFDSPLTQVTDSDSDQEAEDSLRERIEESQRRLNAYSEAAVANRTVDSVEESLENTIHQVLQREEEVRQRLDDLTTLEETNLVTSRIKHRIDTLEEIEQISQRIQDLESLEEYSKPQYTSTPKTFEVKSKKYIIPQKRKDLMSDPNKEEGATNIPNIPNVTNISIFELQRVDLNTPAGQFWTDLIEQAFECIGTVWATEKPTGQVQANQRLSGCKCPTLSFRRLILCNLIRLEPAQFGRYSLARTDGDYTFIRNQIIKLVAGDPQEDPQGNNPNQDRNRGNQGNQRGRGNHQGNPRGRGNNNNRGRGNQGNMAQQNGQNGHHHNGNGNGNGNGDGTLVVEAYQPTMFASMKHMQSRLPSFEGDCTLRDGQDHINELEIIFKTFLFREGDDNYNSWAWKQIFPITLKNKARRWYEEQNFVNRTVLDIKTAFINKFSKWGESLYEKTQRFQSYQWNQLQTSVMDMISDLKRLGLSLNYGADAIIVKIKSILPLKYQENLIQVNDLETLEKRVKELHMLSSLYPATPASVVPTVPTLPAITATVAGMQEATPYMAIHDRDRAKQVTFKDETQTSMANMQQMLENIQGSLETTLTTLGDKLCQVSESNRSRSFQKDRDRDRSRDKSHERSNNSGFSRPRAGSVSREAKCHNCGETRHFFRDCPKLRKCLEEMGVKPEEVITYPKKPYDPKEHIRVVRDALSQISTSMDDFYNSDPDHSN